MFLLYLLLLVGAVTGSHYKGGSMSYTILAIPGNITNNGENISLRITQRHSWRLSAYPCNNTDPGSEDLIGEGMLTHYQNSSELSTWTIPNINASVRCTDYNTEFDYSSGEDSTTVFLPVNSRIEYFYQSCCWITLLSPDAESDWSLKLVVDTNRRPDGRLNNSPKTAMNPIVQVEVGKTVDIHIPMADSDGDPIRCRWGNSTEECGSTCRPKGFLRSNPCVLTYNATRIGHQAVALVIEDFDANDEVISAIPLQFLIHTVNATMAIEASCPDPPIYVGEWPQDSCIGVESNTTVKAQVQIRIPCKNTSTTLKNILTVSPAGFIKGKITNDLSDQTLYKMPIEWTPESDQYGIHQVCFTPVDSQQQIGSQVCLTFQVDVRSPEFTRMTPMGLASSTQSAWTVETDRDIIKPRRSSGVHIRFFKRFNNEEVYRIDVTDSNNVFYQRRQITFFTTGYTWKHNEEYYILLDSGIATLNESCGVESAPINNPSTWIFRVAEAESTAFEGIVITKEFVSPTIEQTSTTRQTTPSPRPACPQWFSFDRISNESTSVEKPYFTFCFTVETTLADVTISANTWVPCRIWKLSGTADPLLELYAEPGDQLLAQNDDGNGLTSQNCYAAVLSYRLQKGDYRVIIRNPKCAYGKFELRLSAEIDRNLK